MNPGPSGEHDSSPSAPEESRARRFFIVVGGILLLYLVTAYVVMPLLWRTDVRLHPDLSDTLDITHTAAGIPGDPLNISLVGSEGDVILAMKTAAWDPADPITFRSSIRIAVDSVFRRPDNDAPVSDLYLFGRKQDLAFEQPVGDSPRQRHHVRFWRSTKLDQGRPMWFGSATFDERVGLSTPLHKFAHVFQAARAIGWDGRWSRWTSLFSSSRVNFHSKGLAIAS